MTPPDTMPDELGRLVYEAFGEVSVACWSDPGGAGTFQADKAAQIADRLIKDIRAGATAREAALREVIRDLSNDLDTEIPEGCEGETQAQRKHAAIIAEAQAQTKGGKDG